MLSGKAEQFKKSRAIERTCQFLFLNGIFSFQKVTLLGLLFNDFNILNSENGLTCSHFHFENLESAEAPRVFIANPAHSSDVHEQVLDRRIYLKTFHETLLGQDSI